jgi:nitrous oxidase accessory protein NosD
MKKLLVVGIVVLFIGMTVSFSTGFKVAEQSIIPTVKGKTLYVGGSGSGNYSKIQDAIDNASDGDTVYVYKGIYYEHLRIVTDLNLFGEDMSKTIIDGKGEETGVEIGAYVNLSGFTIRNSDEGIKNLNLPPPNNIYKFNVHGNIFYNNKIGISIGGDQNHIISENIITNNDIGINFFCADKCEVNNNNFLTNDKHAYFEYVLFVQIMPRIKWNGNYWDDWKIRIPRFIRGEKVIIFVFRPGWGIKAAVFPWVNIDWHPAREPYDIGV